MARRRKKNTTTLAKLLIAAGIGLGGYYLYSTGKLDGILPESLRPGPPTPPIVDPNQDADTEPNPDGALAAGALGLLLAWLEARGGNDESAGQDDNQGTAIAPEITAPDPLELIGDESAGWLNTALGTTLITPLQIAGATVVTAVGLGLVIEQGEQWGDMYSALTPEQQAEASAIVGVEPGRMVIPSNIEQITNLTRFAMELENEEARAQVSPGQLSLLESYASVLGIL